MPCSLSIYFYVSRNYSSHLQLGYRSLHEEEFIYLTDSYDTASHSQWVKLTAELPDIGKPFEFAIKGELWVESGVKKLCVDDIVISPGCQIHTELSTSPNPNPTTTASPNSCTEEQFACASGDQCVSKSLECDYVCECADCSDEHQCGGCDFDGDDWCGWKEVSKGHVKFHWEANNGKKKDKDSQAGFMTAIYPEGVSLLKCLTNKSQIGYSLSLLMICSFENTGDRPEVSCSC